MKDKSGQRFGHLTVVSFLGMQRNRAGNYEAMWECRCDCGNMRVAISSRLSRCGTGVKACSACCKKAQGENGGRRGLASVRPWTPEEARERIPTLTPAQIAEFTDMVERRRKMGKRISPTIEAECAWAASLVPQRAPISEQQ